MGLELEHLVSESTARRGLLLEGTPALLMVSGGGDSVALLHLAHAGVFGSCPLRVLHVDHMLRGDDSREDARFTADLCRELEIECVVRSVDVAAIVESEGGNVEDVARRERYLIADEELDRFCDGLGVERAFGRMVTAHTRDDRVETFLIRAMTGSGTEALASMRRSRGRIVRPLLDVDRATLRTYLEGAGLAWREDAGNEDVSRLRAYVRARVVPPMRGWNPVFSATLAGTLDLLADDGDFLDRLAADALARTVVDERYEERVAFDVAALAKLDPAIARRVLRKGIVRAFPRASRLESSHVGRIVEELGNVRFVSDVTGGLRVRREYDRLTVLPCAAVQEAPGPLPLAVPGEVAFRGGKVSAAPTDVESVDRGRMSVSIDASVLEAGLVVDSAREGDRMRPLGMVGTKKLSDLLVDEKVPRSLRPTIPVVRDGSRIVWVAGVRLDDRYKVTEATSSAVLLTWSAPPGLADKDD